MSWEQFEHDVLACIADSNDNTKMVATATQAYTEELRAGNITQAEYQELLRDLQSQLAISDNMAEMQAKERLNTAINGLITLASFV